MADELDAVIHSIFRFFKELCLTWFTLGFRVSGKSWSTGMNAGKGVAVVTLIEGAILMVIGTWIEIYLGERFYFDRWVIRIAAVALYLVNYYVLATRGHGIKFESEFTNLKKSRKVLLLASCVVMMLVAIAVSIYSVSAYHRYFHIVTKKGF